MWAQRLLACKIQRRTKEGYRDEKWAPPVRRAVGKNLAGLDSTSVLPLRWNKTLGKRPDCPTVNATCNILNPRLFGLVVWLVWVLGMELKVLCMLSAGSVWFLQPPCLIPPPTQHPQVNVRVHKLHVSSQSSQQPRAQPEIITERGAQKPLVGQHPQSSSS